VRRTPVISFLVAALFALAALNEGNLNHWGTTLVLALVAIGAVGVGVWTIRGDDQLK
jgi:uncharacterized membrane protein